LAGPKNASKKGSVLKEIVCVPLILHNSDFQKKLTFGAVIGSVLSQKMGNKTTPTPKLFPQDVTNDAPLT